MPAPGHDSQAANGPPWPTSWTTRSGGGAQDSYLQPVHRHVAAPARLAGRPRASATATSTAPRATAGRRWRAFQTDPARRVFLISLKAGGYGLNLTAADHVILVEPWWNPAVEAQAIDRAHRIGQASPVTASRLIARGTVEERILKLQATKRQLMASAVEDDPLTLPGLTDDDLEALLE